MYVYLEYTHPSFYLLCNKNVKTNVSVRCTPCGPLFALGLRFLPTVAMNCTLPLIRASHMACIAHACNAAPLYREMMLSGLINFIMEKTSISIFIYSFYIYILLCYVYLFINSITHSQSLLPL